MCGLAGIIGEPQGGDIRRMTGTLVHRGPDDEGYFISGQARLGHRRLIVIDRESGQQPMRTPDGRYALVFNGEIYNFCDLKHELESYGAQFRTRSDTEVLLAAYAHWGRASVERLRGMFAFAVWDAKERILFAARDRLGVKPFYYAQIGSTLLFASEMKALLEHPAVERELDDLALDDYLTYLYVPAPRTIFRQIRELPPACWLEWSAGRVSTGEYWDAKFCDSAPISGGGGTQNTAAGSQMSIQPDGKGLRKAAGELKHLLEEAVRVRLVSDVPLGVFLSGGLDSGSIAALAAQQADSPLRTFTIGFTEGGKRYDERAYARRVSEAIGADAREQMVDAGAAELLPQVTRQFDEPFGNPTSLLSYQLSSAARQHMTVALSGDGGDEALLGYPRYQGMALAEWYRRAPALARQTLGQIAGYAANRWNERANGNHFRRRLREFLGAGTLASEQMYFEWVSYFSRELRQRLYTPEFNGRLSGYDSSQFLENLFKKSGAAEMVDRVNYADLHSFLPYNVLRYSDRMSMAHGLEVRCPFTDHRLVEFLARVPWRYKLRITKSKCLLREGARSWLPGTILKRPKLGFNPPMGLWMQSRLQPLLDSYLAPARIRQRGYFRPEVIQRLIADQSSGRRDWSLHLWALISFEEWHRQYLDPRPAPLRAPVRTRSVSRTLQPA